MGSIRKGILRNFAKFAGEHPCQVFVLVKLLKRIIKKETMAQVFPMNFAKSLKLLENYLSYQIKIFLVN